MGYDSFGLFRGWCRASPSCLEFSPSFPLSPSSSLLCSRCRHPAALHQPVSLAPDGRYDANSPEQLELRKRFDERLLSPPERARLRKGRGDAAFRAGNFRTAYEHYTVAIEAEPSAHLFANRCQAYLKAGKPQLALDDARRATELAPDWAKGWYRLGVALGRLQRHAEAVGALETACEHEPGNTEAAKALQVARREAEAADKLAADLERARKSTTRRQAYDAKSAAQFEAKERAKKTGRIKSYADWNDELTQEFEKEYEATWQPPPGVQLLTHAPAPRDDDDEPRIVDVTDEVEAARAANEDAEGGLALEDNGDGGAPAAGGLVLEENVGGEDEEDEESEEDSEDDNYVSDSDDSDDHPPEQFEVGTTTIMLPPRNYTLVHEDGRLHKKDNFEPLSFGMQRVWNDRAPEPVWVQTKNARWWQSATEVVVIAHTVPCDRMKASLLNVSFAPKQIHVSDRGTGVVYLHGETEERIDPTTSTWLTDGNCVTLNLTKANLQLYDGQKKGTQTDTHWHRLLTEDQYVERGMVDADYSDLPEHLRYKKKMADEEHKAKKKLEEEANECALCGKDVRFFCDCRSGDKDYERPLPEGWKDPRLGFCDPIFEGVKYHAGGVDQLKPKPPPQPQPYRGGR